jgi:hypothetical protein
MFPEETRSAIDGALRFRVRLVPYLHSMNHVAATQGVPLVRPMYHLAPDEPAAYEVPNEFAFGSELVVAPITTPRDPVTLLGSATAWLPPGPWTDIHTGVVIEGGRIVRLHRDGASVPALLKAGGILPLAAEHETDATRNPQHLEVLVAPGADGAFVLIEDDDTGTTPETIPTVRSALIWDQASGSLTIEAADGPAGIVPETRTWTVALLGFSDAMSVTVDGRATPATASRGRVSLTVTADTNAAVVVRFAADPRPVTADVPGRLFALLNAAQHPYEAKAAIWRTIGADRSAADRLAELHAMDVPRPLLEAITELLTAVTA